MNMTNYLFEISYDGTRYHGWERKPDQDTVAGRIEAVLTKMASTPVQLIGAGRTDAGVHALAMTANAHIACTLSCDQIREYCNRYLPDDISVNAVRVMPERFHARFHAIGKTYTYTCYTGPAKPVFDRKYVHCIDSMPDIDAMRLAAGYLTGTHDFKSFTNLKTDKSTVRTVDRIDISADGPYLRIAFHGDGFLMNMVRILTGTLLEVGFHKRDAHSIPAVFAALSRPAAGPAAPAVGLCLTKVDY